MEQTFLFIIYPFIFIICLMILIFKKSLQTTTNHLNLPPGPLPLPFIGHLHLAKEPVHRFLQILSQKYGPVSFLKLCSTNLVVVSSPSAVEECFTKNDIILANRPHLAVFQYLAYNSSTLESSPSGENWSILRRLSSLTMLSPTNLTESAGIRKDEILQTLKKIIYQGSSPMHQQSYAKINLTPLLGRLSFDIVLRMIVGKRYTINCDEAEKFMGIVEEARTLGEAPYPGDYLRVLRWIDYGGYMKRCRNLVKRVDVLFQSVIDEYRRGIFEEKDKETMVGRLLCLQKSEPEYYTDDIIKGVMLHVLIGGTDAPGVTLEWAMALLLNHPDVLDKAKSEIHIQVGEDHLVAESDLPKLPNLQSIISETFRMFPAAPLLLPHMASRDCQVNGFDIPRGTTLLVNAWAIHRDPNVWNKPSEFKPERFLNVDPDHYKLLPFGFGRRGCPGATLANRIIGVALGSLIQCFDWKRVSDEGVDMTEARGLNLPKAQPLEAMFKARSITSKFL